MTRRARLARGCVGLLIFAGALELCARVDDYLAYGAPIWGVYNADTLYVRDTLGQRGKPHARFRKWQLNSLGFRGPELEAGRTTIVCFGSSETFGLYEREGFEYPRQLERELNARAGTDRFQVLNAAYPGQSVRSATLRVPEIAAAARPIAALVYGVPANYIWLPYLDAKPLPPGPLAQPRLELRIQERARNLLKATLPERFQTWLRALEINRNPMAANAMTRLPEENIRRYRDDLSRIVAALRAQGIAPILVTHFCAFGDTPSVADRRLLRNWRKFYPMLVEEGFLDMERRANLAMRSLGAEQSVPVIELAGAVPPTRENFADFAHLTDAGAGLVGRKLATDLLPILTAVNPAATALRANNQE